MTKTNDVASDSDLYVRTMDLIWDEISRARRSGGQVILYPHVRADGDALGGCFALARLLRKLEIDALVLLEEEVPEKFVFLPGLELAAIYDKADRADLADRQRVAVAIDSHGADRLKSRETLYDAAQVKIVIDHHVSELPVHSLYYKDTTAAAVCEMIGTFALHLEKRENRELMDLDIATALMTGIMTDTGRFSYSNVTARTFSIASRLKAHGVRMNELSERLFDTMSPARMKLIAVIATGVTYYYGGRLAVAQISLRDREEAGARDDSDFDGLAAMLRTVEGVDVALLLTEAVGGEVRGNLRSNVHFDSAAFARTLGGGGHVPAAGFTMKNTTLKAAWAHCVKAMKTSLGIKNPKMPFDVIRLDSDDE